MKYLIAALFVFITTLVLTAVGFVALQLDVVSLLEGGATLTNENREAFSDLKKGLLAFFLIFGVVIPLSLISHPGKGTSYND